MKLKRKVVLLTLECFSTIGGIQNVCKNLTYTLNDIADKSDSTSFLSLSLYDRISEDNYFGRSRFSGYAGNRLSFFWNALKHGKYSNTVIVSHINLLIVALIIKLTSPKVNVVLLAHGTEIWRKLPLWKRLFMRSAIKIWSVSNYTKEVLIAKHNINPSDVITLHNCLSPFFKPSTNFKKPDQLLHFHDLKACQPVLLSVCRMSEHDWDKGYDLILKMIPNLISDFPTLRYLMVGHAEPTEQSRIEQLIDKLKIKSHVTFVGKVTDGDLPKYYRLCDLFLLPSKKEGFGLVFIEAAGHGCTVISGDQDGSQEALLNGKLGYSVATSNHEALETLTIKCLKAERNPVTKLQIQNHCLEYFNQEKYQVKVEELLS